MKLSAAEARRWLAAPDARFAAALLYGPNRGAAAEAAEALAAWVLGPTPDPLNRTLLAEDELRRDKARLADELEAQSLLGGRRLVQLRCEGESASELLARALDSLKSNAPAAAFLLVEAGDLGPRSKLRSAFEAAPAAAALPFYEEGGAELQALARAMLAEAGLALSPPAEEALWRFLPSERALLRREVEKLVLFAGPERKAPTAEDVAALLASETEAAADEAADAALLGRAAEAAQALEALAAAAGIAALRTLERRILRLLEAKKLMESGLSAAEAGKKLRPPVFFKEVETFRLQAERWSAPQLMTALDLCWRAQLRAMSAGAPQELIAAAAFRAVAGLAARGR